MSFDDRDVRRGMDVVTLDDVLLGTIVWIRRGGSRRSVAAPAGAVRQVSARNGEALGPMPTTAVGNRGPTVQGALASFASQGKRAGRPLDGAELLVLRTPIGPDFRHPLPRLRRIPVSAVQTVSLERVILRVTEAELEAGSD